MSTLTLSLFNRKGIAPSGLSGTLQIRDESAQGLGVLAKASSSQSHPLPRVARHPGPDSYETQSLVEYRMYLILLNSQVKHSAA